eukprot:1162154-Pelagomonas_calceolata.AAC.12
MSETKNRCVLDIHPEADAAKPAYTCHWGEDVLDEEAQGVDHRSNDNLFLVYSSVCKTLHNLCAIRWRCMMHTLVVEHTSDRNAQHMIIGVYRHSNASLSDCFCPLLNSTLRAKENLYPQASVSLIGDWNVDAKAQVVDQHYSSKSALTTYMQEHPPAITLATPLAVTHFNIPHKSNAMLEHAWSTMANGALSYIGSCYYSDHKPVFIALPTHHARVHNLALSFHPHVLPDPNVEHQPRSASSKLNAYKPVRTTPALTCTKAPYIKKERTSSINKLAPPTPSTHAPKPAPALRAPRNNACPSYSTTPQPFDSQAKPCHSQPHVPSIAANSCAGVTFVSANHEHAWNDTFDLSQHQDNVFCLESVRRRSLRNLKKDTMLNDEVINAMVDLRSQHPSQICWLVQIDDAPEVRPMSYWYRSWRPINTTGSEEHTVLLQDRIHVHLHHHPYLPHWTMACIDIKHRKLVHWDSIGGGNEYYRQVFWTTWLIGLKIKRPMISLKRIRYTAKRALHNSKDLPFNFSTNMMSTRVDFNLWIRQGALPQ